MSEKLTIFIVDDDQDIHVLIHQSLANEQYNFVQAEDGESAIKIIDQVKPDLIMLDVIMPGINGFKTCQQIRELESGKNIPLIIMTSLDDMESINQAYDTGATDFILKPFNPTLLNHQIRFLLKSKQTADELRNTKIRLETAQRIAKLGHWEWTFHDNKVNWSNEICQIMGISESETSAISSKVIAGFHPDDKEKIRTVIKNAIREKRAYNLEHRLIAPDGTVKTVVQEAEIFSNENGHPERIVGTLQDITSRKKTEAKINTLAYYNKVTGLPNRTLLKRLLNKYISNAHSDQHIAVLTITLDRFKLITDSYGHAYGEILLRKIAVRLIRSIKSSCYFVPTGYKRMLKDIDREKPLTIAHCDGDEFVVVLPELTEIDDAALIARGMTKSLAKPFQISGHEIRITSSIGISILPEDGENTDLLLKNSATALYHAKRQGGDGYKFYTAKMNAKAFARLALETSLRKAIDEQQFVLYYQPKISLSNQRLTGMEALLRWKHPDHGIIAPGEFINILEKTGLIVPLGEKLIETVCQQIKRWGEDGFRQIPVAINLSPVQLGQKDFHLRISRILKQTGINPRLIELEITESSLMNNMNKTITMLKKLRLIGIQISLDDFGTGYSSLTYLKHFPVNTLKIDQSFIQNVAIDPDDAAIVKGVIAMADSMQLEVVAEGIEDESQLTFLQEIGCGYGQGYYFSKAINVNAFTKLYMKKPDQLPANASGINTG